MSDEPNELAALSHEQWTELYDKADPETRFLIFLERVRSSDAVAPDGKPGIGDLVAVEWENRGSDVTVAGVVAGETAVVVEYLPDGRAVVCTDDGSYVAAEV